LSISDKCYQYCAFDSHLIYAQPHCRLLQQWHPTAVRRSHVSITLPPDAALSPVKTSFIARTKPLVDIEVPFDAVHHFRVQCRTLRPWASLRSSRRILCRLQKHEHAVLFDGGFWNATFYMMKRVLEGMHRLKNTSRNFVPTMLPSCKW